MYVDQSSIGELIEFSKSSPWKPHYPSTLVRRFLTELVSSSNLIFDIHDSQGRVSTAVLLDKVNNPANDACLEILGMRPDADPSALLSKFIGFAKERIPQNRSGFQIGLPDNSSVTEELLTRLGLCHYYDTFEMRMTGLDSFVCDHHPKITIASAADRDEVFEVLCKSFAQNPDTSIPDMNTWKDGFLKSPKAHFYLWKDGGKTLGFATLIEGEDNNETEIRTIGVLPNSRGQGIGQHLLNHCLKQSADLRFKTCHLTVAVTNHKALGLYLRSGFKTTEKYRCYRMKVRD